MIVLTKRSSEKFIVNHRQIACIEMIPETKIVMTTKEYYIVNEAPDEVLDLIIEYTAKVKDVYRSISIEDSRP